MSRTSPNLYQLLVTTTSIHANSLNSFKKALRFLNRIVSFKLTDHLDEIEEI